jgi:acetyl-CoA C-acetyltransferase
MVTGIDMHMTKHVAAVWSTTPGPITDPTDHGPQRWNAGDGMADTSGDLPGPVVLDRFTGPAILLAATVVRNTATSQPAVIALCDLGDGSRCYARSTQPEAIDAVAGDRWVDAAVHLSFNGTTNELKL